MQIKRNVEFQIALEVNKNDVARVEGRLVPKVSVKKWHRGECGTYN